MAVGLHRVGSIGLADLAAVCQLQGLDHLPHPFLSRAWPSAVPDQTDVGSATVRDRLAEGDLRGFRDWIETYPPADIWVEGQVHHVPADTPDVRILAHRAGESGFFAAQRTDEDVVEVFTVSPYEIGAAVAGSAGLTAPGSHKRVVVPGFFPDQGAGDCADADSDAGHGIAVPVAGRRRSGDVVVLVAEVTALAVIQSRTPPAPAWGRDRDKNSAIWVRVIDDGEYLFAPDLSHAVPVTPQMLRTRIDQLITEDIAALRERR